MGPDEHAVLTMIIESGGARVRRNLVESLHSPQLVAEMIGGPAALLESWSYLRAAEFHSDGSRPPKHVIRETDLTLTPLAAEIMSVDLMEHGPNEEPRWIGRRHTIIGGLPVSVMPGDGEPITVPPTEREYRMPYPDMVADRPENQGEQGGTVKRRRDRRKGRAA